ncbi:PepSY-associated TM helix domain-containing protein [Lichenicola cladoniae]|nr:PepSY domain-containing protein [Lichenicola cladoniae]
MARSSSARPEMKRGWPGYRTIWRWHFYAGVFCIPFVLLLSLTGMIYLFKPQIDDLIDWRYEHLAVAAHVAGPTAETRVALAAVPGSTLLAYELPRTTHSAARVIVLRHGEAIRVYVDPARLAVLKTVPEEWRFERIVFNLHGQLLLGNAGSLMVELVASWTIVMLLTGLCLWWPRPSAGRSGAAGLLYPRLRSSGRVFWRDLHGVSALWASMFTLFLLISGLPWAYGWGNYLRVIRSISSVSSGSPAGSADWQVGHVPARDQIAVASPPAAGSMPDMPEMGGMAAPAVPAAVLPAKALDRIVATLRPLDLAYPVLVTPPGPRSSIWTARSDAENRLRRTTITLSADGRILRRADFGQKPLLDRIIGIGVTAHEGRLFGWANVVLNAFTALSMILVSVTAMTMWLGRRPRRSLGAPVILAPRLLTGAFLLLVLALALALPLFGLSVVLVALVERLLLRRTRRLGPWLGLDGSGKEAIIGLREPSRPSAD